jgi:hypothetical protein
VCVCVWQYIEINEIEDTRNSNDSILLRLLLLQRTPTASHATLCNVNSTKERSNEPMNEYRDTTRARGREVERAQINLDSKSKNEREKERKKERKKERERREGEEKAPTKPNRFTRERE